MNAKELKGPQQQAVLDLLVMGMYAGGHLASVEDEKIQRWLGAMGFEAESDRNREFDAAVVRVSPHSGSAADMAAHADALSQRFVTAWDMETVCRVIDGMVRGDGTVAPSESDFLGSLRERFAERL